MSSERQIKLQMSRREFLLHARNAAITTAGVVAINAIAFKFRGDSTEEEREKRKLEAEYALENGLNLEVKYFAEPIVHASDRIAPTRNVENLLGTIAGWYAGDALGSYILRKYPRKTDGVVGTVGIMTGKAVDFISTYVAAKTLDDPRFKEYGLDVFYAEQNPFFSSNPSQKEVIVKSSVLYMLSAFAGYHQPWIGRGYVGASPFIARNNLAVAQQITTNLELGDGVKNIILNGGNRETIENFLHYTDSL